MSNSSLSIAVSALRAHSYAIDTTSNNIANASTPGYRRERVDLQAGYPHHTALGMMGSGVEARNVSRATDALADQRVRNSSAVAANFTARSQVASLAEDSFGEPDRGISNSMSAMFNSFTTLSSSPTDPAARTQVVASLNDVATRVNEIRAGLDGIQTDATTRLTTEIDNANQLADRIAKINTFAKQPGGLPASLADELDTALDTLSQSIGAKAEVQPGGMVRVTVDGRALVDGDHSVHLSVPGTPVGEVDHPSGIVTLGGTAGGLQTAITSDVAGYRKQLDDFVDNLVTTANTAHNAGFQQDGTPGGDLFAQVNGQLTVVPTDGSQIAASDSATGPLSGKVADQLGQLTTTLGPAYRTVVTSVANSVSSLNASVDTAQSVADSASSARDSQVGVNMDEEMTNMLQEQRAYQAAARVISTVDDMMKTLLGM